MKKPLLLVGFVFCAQLPCFAAITPDNHASFDGSSGTTKTINLTIAADADFAVVAFGGWDCAGGDFSASSATVGGSAATLANLQIQDDGGCGERSEVWYIVAPPTGASKAVVVTYPSSMGGIYGSASSWKGVSATGQPDAIADGDGVMCSNPETTSITTVAANSLIIDHVFPSGGTVGAASAGQTELEAETVSYKIASSAGSNSMGWAFTGCNSSATALASFAPAASVGTRRAAAVS